MSESDINSFITCLSPDVDRFKSCLATTLEAKRSFHWAECTSLACDRLCFCYYQTNHHAKLVSKVL